MIGMLVAIAACSPASTPGVSTAPPSPNPASTGALASPTQVTIHVAARDIAFDLSELTAPANSAFAIRFDNKDSEFHNIAVYQDSSAQAVLFRGDIFQGPDVRTYQVPALPSGRYFFRCDVHPTQMTGVLEIT